MLPRSSRLKKGVYQVIKKGKRLASPLLLIYYAPNGSSTTRFAVVTSKKIGGAIVRNKVRRRIQNCLREFEDQIPAGFDIIIMPSKFVKNWSNIPFETIKKTLFDLLKNI